MKVAVEVEASTASECGEEEADRSSKSAIRTAQCQSSSLSTCKVLGEAKSDTESSEFPGSTRTKQEDDHAPDVEKMPGKESAARHGSRKRSQ